MPSQELPPIERDPRPGCNLPQGPARRRLAYLLRRHYRAGKSITDIAAELGRSYGLVHTLLKEAKTKFRPQGKKRQSVKEV